MTKTRTFEYISDPSHGWIKVTKSYLSELFGPYWRKFFTCFSYERLSYVYLEEDQDAATFVKKLKELGITPKWRDRHAKIRSRIRNYTPLRPIEPSRFEKTQELLNELL
jgi:hypothetical protein